MFKESDGPSSVITVESVPDLLRAARAARGHGQREAAAAVGVSTAAWGAWERGTTNPKTRYLPALAAYTGHTMAELLSAIYTPPHPEEAETVDMGTLVETVAEDVVELKRRLDEAHWRLERQNEILLEVLAELQRRRGAPGHEPEGQ